MFKIQLIFFIPGGSYLFHVIIVRRVATVRFLFVLLVRNHIIIYNSKDFASFDLDQQLARGGILMQGNRGVRDIEQQNQTTRNVNERPQFTAFQGKGQTLA